MDSLSEKALLNNYNKESIVYPLSWKYAQLYLPVFRD